MSVAEEPEKVERKRIYRFPPSSDGGTRYQIVLATLAKFQIYSGEFINGFVCTPIEGDPVTYGRAVGNVLTIPGGALGGMRFELLQSAKDTGGNEVLSYMKIMDNYQGVHTAGTFRTDPEHSQPEFAGNPKFLLINLNAGAFIDAIGYSLLIG